MSRVTLVLLRRNACVILYQPRTTHSSEYLHSLTYRTPLVHSAIWYAGCPYMLLAVHEV
jgi:hypothetical protein